MAEFRLEGLGVALITPFNEDKSIDYKALARLIDYNIEGSVDFIVVMGTTGETPTLSSSERECVRSFVRKCNSGRVPLVLGLGGNNTMELVSILKNEDLKGYSAVLSVVPFYSKPTQEGIYQHYKALADASPLPIILYNVPGRTGVNMTAETTLRLANDFPNIIGVKEASGDVGQIKDIIRSAPAGFSVISGDDGLTLDLMKEGATGVISVVGNAFPEKFSEMVHMCGRGEFDKATSINESFGKLIRLLFVDGNPGGIKCVLKHQNLIKNELRLPLVAVSESTDKAIYEVLKSDPLFGFN